MIFTSFRVLVHSYCCTLVVIISNTNAIVLYLDPEDDTHKGVSKIRNKIKTVSWFALHIDVKTHRNI